MGPNPRILTTKISEASSAKEVLGIVGEEVESPIFDDIHASAALTTLAKFKRRRQLSRDDAMSPVWAGIATRLGDLKRQKVLRARAAANVLWALAVLWEDIGVHMSQLLLELAEYFQVHSAGMNPQDLSNSLWAAATLKDAAPQVLKAVPALAGQIPGQVGDMVPQALSNSLWAAASLKDAVPAV